MCLSKSFNHMHIPPFHISSRKLIIIHDVHKICTFTILCCLVLIDLKIKRLFYRFRGDLCKCRLYTKEAHASGSITRYYIYICICLFRIITPLIDLKIKRLIIYEWNNLEGILRCLVMTLMIILTLNSTEIPFLPIFF